MAGNTRVSPSAFLQADDIPWTQLERRNIDDFSIDGNMFMRNQLTGSRAGWSNPKPVNRVVQTGFQQLDEVLTGNALAPVAFVKGLAELPLQHTIRVLRLLLFLQLKAILTRSLALLRPAMLAVRIAVLYQILAIA